MSGKTPQSTGGSSSNDLKRRTFLKATGAAGALTVGASASVGSASAGIAEFDELSIDSDNRIVNESGEVFKMRGLNVPDPKRMARTANVRGKNMEQLIDLITNNENGWHPRVIRLPAQPTDIGEHPNGNTGELYGEDAPEMIDPGRRKMIPPQPDEYENGAFTREMLEDYVEDYYRPAVDLCKERGVYAIVDFHRHWHEQPPGGGSAGQKNHLPYDSDNTLYWAKNTYYGEDEPASWGYVDVNGREEFGDSVDDYSGTPWDAWEVNQDLVDETVMFWDVVAEEFADDSHVIFEPYNEPTAPGIWGPVEGCGADKQKPLWNTFRNDFADPIMSKVREHAPDKLALMGLPGWCQATQALHWSEGWDLGYDNMGAVWHNYGGHAASQLENWMNDTDYEYMEIPDPYLDQPKPPSEIWRESCYGWESYEAQGIQEAYQYTHIAATEFGWIDNTDVSHWLQGATGTGQGTTRDYGIPVIEALESDDRISWVAWCADNRWLPTMFDVDFKVAEGELDLDNGNWYETDPSEYPDNCPDLPCNWELMGNPNMGKYIKEVLAEKKDDQVPFDMETIGGGGNTGPGDGPEPIEDGMDAPTNMDSDQYYEDVNGDGELNFNDLVDYYQNMDQPAMTDNKQYYDYNDDGELNFNDLVELYQEMNS